MSDSLEIVFLAKGKSDENSVVAHEWNLFAHSKKTLKGWDELCEQVYENAARCYRWLRNNPTQRKPGRCYELKHKHYAGVWAYEFGTGHRVYYTVDKETKRVCIYYAGPHPSKIPYPPSAE